MRIALVLLDIERGPAATGRSVSAIAADVNAKRQPEFLGAFVDRPVAAAAERFVGARADVCLLYTSDAADE